MTEETEVIEGDVVSDRQIESEIIVSAFDKIVASTITDAQFAIISGRTPSNVIKKRPGKGGKIFSYVPHGYVIAVLNRAFGFDWDIETIPQKDGQMFLYMDEVYGPNPKRPEKEVLYRGASVLVNVRLTVRIRNPEAPQDVLATITKTATGEKEVIRGMSWGGLIKSAESDGFKKAASKLGVALDLYWKDEDNEYMPMSQEQIEEEKDKLAAAELRAERRDEIVTLSESLSPSEIAERFDDMSAMDVVLTLKGK